MYSVFNENSIKSNTVIKWISKSNFNFDIHEVFKICFEVTDNTSVQWVQFRILHRFLLVIYFLKKNNINTHDCCAYCKTESDTFEHVFLFLYAPIMEYSQPAHLQNYWYQQCHVRQPAFIKQNNSCSTNQFIFQCLMQKKYHCLQLSFCFHMNI